ncbi:MAG: response regulator [Anaerolineae bacterium]
MDINLAGKLDGIETAAQIQTRFDIPVVYLTSYGQDTMIQRAKITKPYGYLTKPVDERELCATIETAFYRHQLETRLKENERWLDTTLRSIGDAVIATDARKTPELEYFHLTLSFSFTCRPFTLYLVR